MNKIKFVLDREPITSEQIKSRQDFDKIKLAYQPTTTAFYKTSWFYGAIGASAIAIPVSLVSLTGSNITDSVIQEPERAQVVSDIIVPNVSTMSFADTEKTESVAQIDRRQTSVRQAVTNQEVSTNSTPIVAEEAIVDVEETEEIVPPVSNKTKTMLPHFGVYYTGEIPVNVLMKQVLLTNDELAVISFNIRYFDQYGETEKKVKGAKIPLSIIEDIKKYNIGQMVFITDVMAEHRSTGNQYPLSSMNFTPILAN